MRYFTIPLTIVLLFLLVIVIFVVVLLMRGDMATLIDAFPFLGQ